MDQSKLWERETQRLSEALDSLSGLLAERPPSAAPSGRSPAVPAAANAAAKTPPRSSARATGDRPAPVQGFFDDFDAESEPQVTAAPQQTAGFQAERLPLPDPSPAPASPPLPTRSQAPEPPPTTSGSRSSRTITAGDVLEGFTWD